MQKVFQMVADSEAQLHALETAVLNAVQFPERQELYVNTLRNHGFAPEWRYCVALAQLGDGAVAQQLPTDAQSFLEDQGIRAIQQIGRASCRERVCVPV